MFFVPRDNLKTLFFIQIYRYREVFFKYHIVAFFILKEVRILRPLFNALSHSINATTKGPN